MFIFKICVWIKSGNIFLAHPVGDWPKELCNNCKNQSRAKLYVNKVKRQSGTFRNLKVILKHWLHVNNGSRYRSRK